MPSHKGGSAGRQRLPVLLERDELELRTWLQLVRTYLRMERRLERLLEERGLSLPQFDILATLAMGEGITQQELAQRMLVTKGNICGMIDRMETNGWVERRPDKQDRRANRLFLMPAGRKQLARSFPDQHAAVQEMMSALRPEELQTLYEFLDRLEEDIEN
ncbi:MAG TPA: MarR family transcriptional regulator [Gemmataceae bacterium]|jgi:MarR family transcriptional regulator, organic hydroperoxide resistance regulator|nr:MarR family transcriptional regulator [Gemmataceae bacterium]